MANELVPYHGRDDIAFVSRELATERDQLKGEIKKHSDFLRVSDMYIGRYGVLGYVEMNLMGGSENPYLGGILEVPGKLVESMREVPGLVGYLSEILFRQDKDFTTVYGREDLSHPSLEGVALFDSSYHWYPYPDTSRVEPARVNERTKELEEEVINFITQFDGILDRFVPENKKQTYSTLQILGPGQRE